MHHRALLAAVVVAVVPSVASAVTLSQLDVIGNLNPSTSVFSPDGQVDFDGVGTANIATGVFSGVITNEEALGSPTDPTVFQLFDIEFEDLGPQLIYSGGGFEFFATAFLDFDNDLPGRAFDARGFITGLFGRLPGEFSLSTQETSFSQARVSFSSTLSVIPVPASALLLISAMLGLGWLSFRRRAAAA